MRDLALQTKTRQQLIEEVEALRRKVAALETAFSGEHNLPESEETYRYLFGAVSDAIVILDAETRQFIDANESALDLYGYSRGELLRLRLDDVTAEREKSLAAVEQTLIEGHLRIPERNHRRKDGAIFPAEISTNTFVLQGRQVLCEVIRDITERKQAEDALRGSEKRFRQLVEIVPGAIMVMDGTGQIGLVNERTEAMFGYGGDELLGMPIETLLPERSREAHQAYRADFFAQPDTRLMGIGRDLAGRRKDGAEFPVEIGLSYMQTEEGTLALAFVTDITERKRNEETIQYNAMLLANVSDAIISADTKGRILSWNKGAEEIYGWQAGEAIGNDISDFLKTEYPETQDRAAIGAQLVAEGFWRGEISQVNRDGKRLDIQVSTRLLRDSAGNPIGHVTVNRDITRRKRVEETLSASEAKYRNLVDHSVQGMVIFQEGHFVFGNTAMSKITGYSLDEMLAMSTEQIINLVHPEDREQISSNIRQRLAGLPVKSIAEHRIIRADGQIRTVELLASLTTYEGKPAIQCAYIDITERRQAQEALIASEARFRTLAEQLPDTIYIYDVPLRAIDYINRDSFLGYSLEELQRSGSLYSNLYPEDKDTVYAYWIELTSKSHPEVQSITYQMRDKQEKWHWIQNRDVVLEQDPNGNPLKILISLTDITELKEAEDALRLSEERLRLVTDNMRDMIMQADEKGIIRYVSPSAQQVWGIKPAEMVGTHLSQWLGLVHPKDREILRKTLAERLATGEGPSLGSYRFQDTPGQYRWKEHVVSPFYREDGSRAGFIYVIRDIAERMTANENLRKANERFSKTFHSSPIGISISTLDEGRYVDVNHAFVKMYGFERREDLIGKTSAVLGTWVHIAERPRMIQAVREAASKGSFPYQFRHQSGEERDALCACEIIELDGEECVLSMFQDITDQKRNEEELERHRQHLAELVEQRTAELKAANDQLIALSRVKDEFVSNVSHELRTPITSLVLRLHLLRKMPEKLDYHLDIMEREINRLHHTIEDLLQLSRLDRNQTAFKLSPVDINAMVERHISDRLLLAEAKKLNIAFVEERSLPPVSADRGLLEQTLGVLLTNAINYTPPGGSITVQTLAHTDQERRWVGFSVSDTGPGISPEDQSQLFERFFRGQVGRASEASGTGLGLAIAKEIIERHGGRIEVQSSGVAGEGAHFTVCLPAPQ